MRRIRRPNSSRSAVVRSSRRPMGRASSRERDRLQSKGSTRANNYLVGPDADLTGVDLTGADLTGADLTSADLSSATLTGSQYDEFTIFPSGETFGIPQPTCGLPSGAAPWDAGMIPVPEPSSGLLLVCGCIGLAGLAAISSFYILLSPNYPSCQPGIAGRVQPIAFARSAASWSPQRR